MHVSVAGPGRAVPGRLSAVSVADLPGAAAAGGGAQSISRRQLWMFVRRGRPRLPCPGSVVPRIAAASSAAAAGRPGAARRLEWCQLQIAARCCGSGTIDGVATVSYNDRCLCERRSVDLATCMVSQYRPSVVSMSSLASVSVRQNLTLLACSCKDSFCCVHFK